MANPIEIAANKINDILGSLSISEINSVLNSITDQNGKRLVQVVPEKDNDEWSSLIKIRDVVNSYEKMKGKNIFEIIKDDIHQQG